MKKILDLETKYDEFGVCEENVYDGNNCIFSVHDLTDYPEDATISRDLFSAFHYLRAIRYGIELAKQGFEEVEYISK